MTCDGLLIREYKEREMSNQEWPIGRRIIEVRPLHKSEMDACDWEDWQDECAVCILLDDGSKLWPSCRSRVEHVWLHAGLPEGRTLWPLPLASRLVHIGKVWAPVPLKAER